MKKIIIIVTIMSLFKMNGQEIAGQWFGILKVPGMQLNIVFNISKTATGLTTTMDSPDQKAIGIPVTTTTFQNSVLKLAIPAGGIEYEGIVDKNNNIVGSFKQAGQVMALNLSRNKVEKDIVVRPQEPKKPFDYLSEDLTFENAIDKITLAGTLTLPKTGNNFPAVILISGSGPQNRDEEILGHKPFMVLADYLTKNGIAVLRFDDRGTAKSTGNFGNATTNNFAADVLAAVKYLQTRKEINHKKIGLIGHSEGGIIAPMVAANSVDIAFIVLMAGTGIRGDKLLLLQKELIERQMGIPENEILKGQDLMAGAYKVVVDSDNNDKLSEKISSYFKEKVEGNDSENEIKSLTNIISSNWMKNFIKLDPAVALQKVKCPVLAINGEKDLQVPANINLKTINDALLEGGNKKVTTTLLPNLNHLFQECTTGAPAEYGTIEQTVAPVAMQVILNWVKIQTK